MMVCKMAKYGCVDCRDIKRRKDEYGSVIRYCEHDECPYWDDKKMAEQGVTGYVDWIAKGRPDCYKD